MREKITALLDEKLQACPTRKDNAIEESDEINTPKNKQSSPNAQQK